MLIEDMVELIELFRYCFEMTMQFFQLIFLIDQKKYNEFCWCLLYLGNIRNIQLEYTYAKECLLQDSTKSLIVTLGFRAIYNKWAIIGFERTVFMQKGMEKALRLYIERRNAVRIGDLELFRSIIEKFSTTFNSDQMHNLIVRL